MFHRRTDASKAAVSYLVEHLRERGFRLLDAQVPNPHLISLGAVEIPRRDYLERLRTALALVGHFLRRTAVVMMCTRVPARHVRFARPPCQSPWWSPSGWRRPAPARPPPTSPAPPARSTICGPACCARLSHDRNAFTQGLVYYEGRLYESTGLVGRSSLRRVDLESGRGGGRASALDPPFFGEGLARVGDELVQLTWQNGKALRLEHAAASSACASTATRARAGACATTASAW